MTWLRSGLTALAGFLSLGAAPPEDGTLIRGARVFDGTGAPAVAADVLIRGDRIQAVGPRLVAPRGTRVVDARGLTLIPGLHDLHTHLRSPAFGNVPEDLGKAYASHLPHGVTSVNDFSMSGEMIAPVREMTASGAVTAPNLKLAVRMGVPGGHGTEYGWGTFFTMEASTPRSGELMAQRALSYRPDVIKVFADGWRYGRLPNTNSMDEATLAAIVRTAHTGGVPVITHTVTADGARAAANARVDALGHGIGDAPVTDDLIRAMREGGTAYVPTMVVYEPQQNRAFSPGEWRNLRTGERAREEARLAQPIEPITELESRRWTILQDNLRRLRAGGVRIGIGTDAGIGGVYHGSSVIREMRIMTQLGLTPAEAIVAATSTSAAILRRGNDQGRIAPGLRADLVLTGGRPDQTIEDLYDVRRVFVGGREMDLGRLRQAVESPEMTPLPVTVMAGPIHTGRGPAGRTDLDTLPVETYESGSDHTDVLHTETAAERRLFLTARLGAAPQPFGQLVLPLTRGAVQLADASAFSGIAFDARGTGRYSVAFDSYGLEARSSFRAPFSATGTRSEIRIPFSAFQSADPAARLDLKRLRALSVRLEGEPGATTALEIGNVRFYR